jgi:hypothetical protein
LLGVYFLESASVERVARLTFATQSSEEAQENVWSETQDFGPLALRAILSATHFAFQRWRIDDEVTILPTPTMEEAWLEGVRAALSSRSAGFRNNFLRALQARTKNQRDAARSRLERAWHDVGLKAGVIPYRRGGLQCRLPSEFLADLQREGRKLVEEIIRVSHPSDAQRQAVRPLIAPEDDWFSKGQQALLREMEPEAAATRQRAMLLQADAQRDTVEWVRRLLFPMLSAEEIDLVLDRTGGKSHKRSVDAAATDLLAHRIPTISRTTILNRISNFR